jgi:hypothetical protein
MSDVEKRYEKGKTQANVTCKCKQAKNQVVKLNIKVK